MNMKIVFTCVGLAIFIIVVVILASFRNVPQNSICQSVYYDNVGGNVKTHTKPGFTWVGGPISELRCVSTTVQTLEFQVTDSNKGLNRAITIITSDYVPHTIMMTIQFSYLKEKADETLSMIGFDDDHKELALIIRQQTRNAGNQFLAQDFVDGKRDEIARLIQDYIETKARQVGIHVKLRNVALKIKMDGRFEEEYELLELVNLQLMGVPEKRNLLIIDENRKNRTEHIIANATRNKLLRGAVALTNQALLKQEQLVTEAETRAAQAMIVANSTRIKNMIKLYSELDKILASQTLLTDSEKRSALVNETFAETQRINMENEAEGKIKRAYANQTRDVLKAKLNRTLELGSLVAYGIDQTKQIQLIGLNANATVTQNRLQRTSNAFAVGVYERAKTNRLQMLMDTLNLTSTDLAKMMLFKALGNATNLLMTVDHEAVPLRLMESEQHPFQLTSENVITAAAAVTTDTALAP